MSRPSHTNAVGPSFSITIPPGWYAIATAISRKTYVQGLDVAFDIVSPQSRIFGSKPGTANDQMKITLDGTDSLPFTVQKFEYQLDFTFYYSTKSVRDAEELVDNDAKSSKINVLRTEKRPGSFAGPDSVTYFVFVEDTPTQEAGTGQYDDAVAMVHLVQKPQ
ncbi:hypothetical protein BDQ12DRAFT_689696 [Crucibulum laeve]|uniref:Uncharacterized protein n=1 Tax=Crucibulum laeve TaxID=68775 RepID=A0A5C3LMU4_9AGAR|nr:hypothetical protein BDQ12DRAFT_689696 [Crucibulum laeve]